MQGPADHRSRVGALRRDRTRARLLLAAVQAVAERGSADVPIEALLEQAEVSRGTFYKYFPDARSLLAAAAQAASDELISHLHAVVALESDPPARTAVGVSGVLAMFRLCPPLGELVTRTGWPHAGIDPSHAIYRLVGPTLALGRQTGRMAPLDEDFALNLFMGLVIAAAYRYGAGPTPPDFDAQVVAAALRVLGLPPDEASRLASTRPVLPPLPEGSLLASLAALPPSRRGAAS